MIAGHGRLIIVFVSVTVALVVAIVLAGAARGLALYAYILALGALGLWLLSRRISRRLPQARPFRDLARQRVPERPERLPQLQSLERHLAGSRSSTVELHVHLRPVVRQIAGARLDRRYGVDLERDPERAMTLLGERTWELVRPDRRLPEERFAAGWSTSELRDLIDELEET
jgi:hypothetical protein